MLEKISKIIRDKRRLMNLSQSELADKAKIAPGSIKKIEAGANSSIKTIEAIFEVLKLRIEVVDEELISRGWVSKDQIKSIL